MEKKLVFTQYMKKLFLAVLLVFMLPSLSFAIEGAKTYCEWKWYRTDEIVSEKIKQIRKLSKEENYKGLIPACQEMIYYCKKELQEKIIDAQNIKEIKANIGNCYYNIAESYYAQSKYEQALEYFQELISNYAEETGLGDIAQVNIGNCYHELRRYEQAVAQLRKAIQDYPNSSNLPFTYYLMAWCYFMKNDYQSSEQAYRELLDKYPEGEYYSREFVQYNIAECLRFAEKFQLAEKEFKEYISQYPQGKYLQDVHEGLVICYGRQGKLQEFFNELSKLNKMQKELIIIYIVLLGGGILILTLTIFLVRYYYKKKGATILYPQIKWKLRDMVAVLFLFSVVSLMASFVWKELFLGTILGNIIIVGIINYIVLLKYKLKVSALGFKKVRFKASIKYVVSGVVICGLFSFIYEFCAEKLFHIEHVQFFSQLLLSMKAKGQLFFPILLAIIVAPFCEEVLFRGFLYSGIKKYLGIKWAIILSALFFGFAHLEWAIVIPLIFIGAVSAYLYEKSNSLWIPITVHILNNTIAVILILINGL